MYPFILTDFMTNNPIKSGNIDLFLYSAQIETGVIRAGERGWRNYIRDNKVTA